MNGHRGKRCIIYLVAFFQEAYTFYFILFYSFDKIFHRIIELGQTRVPAHDTTFLAADGSSLASLPPQSSRSGIIYYSKLFLFTSESISQKLFNLEGLKETLECLFWLWGLCPIAPGPVLGGCSGAGLPLLGLRACLGCLPPLSPVRQVCFSCFTKKGIPQPVPFILAGAGEGSPGAVTLQTHPPGASQGLLLLLGVNCGLQTDTERGRSDTHGDSDTSVL